MTLTGLYKSSRKEEKVMRSHHENKRIVHPSMCMFIWDTKKIIPLHSDFIKAKRPDFLNEHVKNIVTSVQNEVLASR